jgi:hypothetical protein
VKKREEYGLDRAIVDLNSILFPCLTVIDATIALEGFVPGPRLVGNPVIMDTIIAGFDPVAVDAVGCRTIGIDPAEIRHIRLAYERGLGRMREEEIEIVGSPIRSVLRPLKMDISEPARHYKNLTIIEGQGCSGCSVTNRMALSFFSGEEIDRLGPVTLVVGAAEGLGEISIQRPFFIGNCAIRSNRKREGVRIGGCPPPGLWIRKKLTE